MSEGISDIEFTQGEKDKVSGAVLASIVQVKGTKEGVVFRLDPNYPANKIKAALMNYLKVRRDFFRDNEVIIEWVGENVPSNHSKEIASLLKNQFGIEVKSEKQLPEESLCKDRSAGAGKQNALIEARRFEDIDSKSPLLGGIEELDISGESFNREHETPDIAKENFMSAGQESFSHSFTPVKPLIENAMPSSKQPELIVGSFMDEADTKCFYGTLRSGQKIETELSVIVVGDVNSGAEVVAGGDIIVLGKLRGVAHAGAFDESGGGRFVFALDMEPTQLRIGQVISRGNDKEKKGRVLKSRTASKAPEVARVDKDVIVVESYNSKVGVK